MACIHDATIAPSDWRVILCDQFDGNVNGWPTGNSSDEFATSSLQIANGKYQWNLTANRGTVHHSLPKTVSLTDFYLTVVAQRISGVGGAGYGVIFRSDGANYYYLSLRDDQIYRFAKLYRLKWTILTDWTRASAIRPGEANRLTVKAEGSHFTFFVNDQQVGEADDNQLTAGGAGLAVEVPNGGESAVFEFDNFELRAPSPTKLTSRR